MKWLNHLDYKFGRYAIPHLMYYLSGIMLAIFFNRSVSSRGIVQSLLALDMGLVAQGQIWRLITFIFCPLQFSVLDFIQSLFLLSTGQRFGKRMGAFRFNVYYLCGVLGSILAAWVTGYGVNHFEFVPFF